MNYLNRVALTFLAASALAGCGNPAGQSLTNPSPDDPTHEVIRNPTQGDQDAANAVAALGLQMPSYTPAQLRQVLASYAYVDPHDVVPASLKAQALAFYNANAGKIPNAAYLSVVDFSLHSSKSRFFIMNMKTGAVTTYHVAHGSGSDPGNTGYATRFSNVVGSEESSLGYYLTADTYDGKHGLSLRMNGLSSTNSNVLVRDIVIHGASYVYDSNIQAGRSWGCFALPMDDRTNVINLLHGGSVIFAALEN